MRISSTFIRLALLSVVLIFSVLALANGPGRTRSQEVTTATLDALPATSDTLVVPASDSSALARALSAAGFRAPGQPLHLYLEGGTYTFADPSSAEAPSLPPILNTVVIHGNEAVIRLYDEGGASDSLAVTATGDLTLKHVTLLSGSARAIVNDGRLRLEDSRVANDQGAPDYYLPDGGGIENRGVLEVTRTVFERNRLLSRSAPGGAIWNAGRLTVTCARFMNNVASAGGAVYNATDGEARITHSLFDGNRANGGGAIFNAAAVLVEAGGNWWRGGIPAVNSLYAGVDTVSDGVTFAPVADADLTQNDPACAALPPEPLPALPRLAAQATRTPTPAGTATPTPVGRGLVAPRYIPLPDDEWISFSQFTLSSLDYLSLVDSAVHTQEDAIQLMQGETPTTLYAGALWSPSKQTLSGGFHTAFRFRVTHLVDSGGDGFAFVIQNTGTGAVGIGGCSNGYNGISGVFAVEFDLYWNNYFCAETQDPSDNHLGVMTGNHLHTNPALVYAVPKPTLNFKDGQVHSVVIDYELDPPRLEINLDDGLVTWTANINPAWLPLDGQNKAWVGLVAGQFGARANVDILDWQFEHSQQNPTVTPTPTPTLTPSPTFTPTAAPSAYHITCDLPVDTFANVRNFPASDFITEASADGQIVMRLEKGTMVNVYETRLARDGVAWARIADYEAYFGSTLWIRTAQTSDQPLLVAGAPSACSQLPFPNLTATPQPTASPSFTLVAAGCASGNVCPHLTWNPSQDQVNILAFVLACEAGNSGSDQTRADALAAAYVIRNRMKSLPYNGTADEVVRQSGQFECWLSGASSGSGITATGPTYGIDEQIRSYAQALWDGTLPDQYGLPFNGSIRYVGLYYFGLFSEIGDAIQETPGAVMSALEANCTTPNLSNVFIGLAQYGPARVNANAYFSDDPKCSY